MLFSFQNLITNVSAYFSVVTFIVGLIFFKSVVKNLKSIFVLVTIAAFIDITTMLLEFSFAVNVFIFHLYTVLEFSLFLIFYYTYFLYKHIHILVFYVITLLFFVICFLDYTVFNSKDIDFLSITVESSLIIVTALFSFNWMSNYYQSVNIINVPFFWINTAVLLYFSGNLLVYVFSKTLKPDEFYSLYSYVHSPLNITYNVLISIAFYKTKNK